jgi:hypothetical protein
MDAFDIYIKKPSFKKSYKGGSFEFARRWPLDRWKRKVNLRETWVGLSLEAQGQLGDQPP